MKINDYHFITHWQVPGKIEDVADILSDAADLPRWWPSVYLAVQEIKPGDENGLKINQTKWGFKSIDSRDKIFLFVFKRS